MKSLFVLSAACLVVSALAGCADTPAPTDPGAAVASREISRDDAIGAARYDAMLRYRLVNFASISANRTGNYWVVDLRGQGASGIRYSITAADGSIRETRMIE